MLDKSRGDLERADKNCEELKRRVAEYGLIEPGIRIKAKEQKIEYISAYIDKSIKEINDAYINLKSVQKCINDEEKILDAEMKKRNIK